MIKLMDDLPDHVVGFEAIGEVTTADYRDVLAPAFAAAAQGDARVRVLAVLGPEFDGFGGGAMLEDARAGLRHWSQWERIAIVTDRDAIDGAIRWLGWLVPGEIEVFASADLAAARAWVVAT